MSEATMRTNCHDKTFSSFDLEQEAGGLDAAVRLYKHVRMQGGDDEEAMMVIVADLMVERYEKLMVKLLGPGWIVGDQPTAEGNASV